LLSFNSPVRDKLSCRLLPSPLSRCCREKSSGEFNLKLISPTFYEHLLRWYSFAKKLQSRTVIREKLRKTLFWTMLVELTPTVEHFVRMAAQLFQPLNFGLEFSNASASSLPLAGLTSQSFLYSLFTADLTKQDLESLNSNNLYICTLLGSKNCGPTYQVVVVMWSLILRIKANNLLNICWFKAVVPNIFLLAYPPSRNTKTHVPVSELGRHFTVFSQEILVLILN